MTNIEQVSGLKKEASADPVFNDVLHVFAMRERARKDVTLGSLIQSMKKGGFGYSPKDVAPVLEKLSRLGFGKIERDQKGRIRALRDIRVTLQSLGTAASQKDSESEIKSFRPRNRFWKLKTPKDEAPKTHPVRARLAITLTINDKPVSVQIPEGLSPTEVASLLTKLESVA